MDPKDWQKIKLAFNECLDLPAEEWASFVGGLSAPTRGEVERLLANYRKAEEFIESPAAVGFSVGDAADPNIGRRIDDYEIIELIGTGGMGNVYLAEQRSDGLIHRVAIKLIKRGMDTRSVLKRFVQERQILANLEHPNIARFLDGGSTDDGLPYFIMEFIDGEPIRKYCDDRDLSVEKRLEIFQTVCAAASFAHQNLVVHRDLKPSNILVTKSGEAKLLDFGVAKLLQPDESPATGEETLTMFRALTPEYASPEQMHGLQVTTTTDVYSLGVVLYELLTGSRPRKRDGSSFSGERSATVEPVKPSSVVLDQFSHVSSNDSRGAETDKTLNRVTSGISEAPIEQRSTVRNRKLLQGDLDNIILKALHDDPSRRYQSVQQFSEDIRRHLVGLPVSARPDTVSYRIGKFVSRHKAGVVSTAAAALLLVLTTTIAVWQAGRATAERAKAESRFTEVRSLANSMIFEIHDSIRDLSGSTPARKLLVSRALDYLDRLASESQNDMNLKRELAQGYEKIADVQGGAMGSNLGDSAGAIASYEKALAIRESLSQEASNFDDKYASAMLNSKIFRVMMQISDLAKAETHCRRAIEILDELTASQPDKPLYAITAARFNLELGELLASKAAGNNADALKNYRDSITKAERMTDSPEFDEKMPDGLSINEKRFSVMQMAYRRLGQNAETAGQSAEALDFYRKALDATKKTVVANNPPKPQAEIVLAIGLGNVARLKAKTGDYEEAVRDAEEMIKICERTVNADPQNHLASSQLSLAYGSLGYVHLAGNRLQSALEMMNKSREMQERIRAKSPDDVYNIGNLGETFAALGEIHEKLAADSAANLRKNSVADAKSWHQKSLDIWLDLRARNQLPAYFANKIDEQNQAIARLHGST